MPLPPLIDDALAQTPPGRCVWVALSGGLDSSLLLALVAEASRRHPRPLHALHVHHGLQDAADAFEVHCRRFASRVGVPLFVERVRVDPSDARGPEGAARAARYAAFARRVAPGETLLLAQHRDDQAETFLLASLRGSGVRGLAAMPARRDWRGRTLVRPLLALTRRELRAEAENRRLAWVEDPSNDDLSLDRNWLRRSVVPKLVQRWPHATEALARSAAHAGETETLLGDLAELDLARLGGDPAHLPVATLAALSPARQRLLIRHACATLGLPAPPAQRLASLLGQLGARRDAAVQVAWPGAEARVWRGVLHLMAPRTSLPPGWSCDWDGTSPLSTPRGCLALSLEGGGERPLQVLPRQGGERLRLAGRGGRDLKRLLQERGVPPWRRQALLVVWCAGEVAAVLDPEVRAVIACAEGFRFQYDSGMASGSGNGRGLAFGLGLD